MKKFIIVIEETVVEEFEVTAESAEKAMAIAEQKYKSSEFELAPGEVQYKQMRIVNPENEVTEWIEF